MLCCLAAARMAMDGGHHRRLPMKAWLRTAFTLPVPFEKDAAQPSCQASSNQAPHSCNHQGLPCIHWGYFHAPQGSCHAPQQLPMGLGILHSLGLLLQVRPAVNQVEVHPYFRNQALIDYCAKEGVHVTAYSSLGTPSSAGHLVKKSAPNPSHVSGSELDCDPLLLAVGTGNWLPCSCICSRAGCL